MRDDGSDPVSVGGRERPVTGASAQWALSPLDYCAHAVNDPHNGPPGVMVARCGHHLPVGAGLDVPRAALCPACVLMIGPELSDPHGLPASNRIWPWLQSGER